MTKLRVTGAAAAAGLLTASLALAQEPGAMAAPKPAAELDQLKVFVGTWNCTGTGNIPSPHPVKATVTTKKDLSGMWYTIRYSETKTKDNPMPYTGTGFWGYDAANKKFVGVWVDSMGGWSTSSTTGWAGDKLVWAGEGPMMGKVMQFRDTFTRKGAKEFVHMGEMNMNGQWTKGDEETCTRIGGAAAAAPANN